MEREVLRGGPHQNDVRSSMEVLTTQGHKLGFLINRVGLARGSATALEQAVELEGRAAHRRLLPRLHWVERLLAVGGIDLIP